MQDQTFTLSLTDIANSRKILEQFRGFNELDIQKIWRRTGQPELSIDELAGLKYDYDIPLYQKMIFRYRQGKSRFSLLYSGIDDFNKTILLQYFGIYRFSPSSSAIINILDLLRHITYWLAEYQICEILYDIGSDINLSDLADLDFSDAPELQTHDLQTLLTNRNEVQNQLLHQKMFDRQFKEFKNSELYHLLHTNEISFLLSLTPEQQQRFIDQYTNHIADMERRLASTQYFNK
jgi:hypothetical protein